MNKYLEKIAGIPIKKLPSFKNPNPSAIHDVNWKRPSKLDDKLKSLSEEVRKKKFKD